MKRTLQVLAVLFLAPLYAGRSQDAPTRQTPDLATLSPPVRALVEKLRGTELAGQLEGAAGLGLMGERAAPAIPFLIRVLERYDGMVEVDSALMKYFEPGTSFLVYQGKANTINPAQLVAAANLARIGRPAIQPLSVALQGADPTELYFAHLADALARIPDPAATAILMNHLKGTDRHARSRAAAALRWNIDPASLDGLIAALDDADEDVRGEAVRSLERRSGQTFGPDAAKWRAWRAGQSGTPPGL